MFKNDESVCGVSLFNFLDWMRESECFFSRGETGRLTSTYGVLALPAVQRTAVWTPKQVVDLWDSLFRGLPIGSFYLVRRSGQDAAQGRGMAGDAWVKPIGRDGFDLLDGQQRTRAMLLGLMGPMLEERCLWVDLGADAKSHHIRVHLTSASQPFGYQPENGQKLPIADRRKARENLEYNLGYWEDNSKSECNSAYKGPLLKADGESARRRAYDHELFEAFLKSGEQQPAFEPPRPHRASASTYPLHSLLQAWRKGGGEESGDRGMEALRAALASRRVAPPDDRRLKRLDEAFRRVAAAQVALLQVDPATFERGDGAGSTHESLLMLFDRIGAGGTSLTTEERLFSIYKHHQPRIHNLVNDIYGKVGRVLPPTKIVASALRIANARTHEKTYEGNTVPDVATFAKEMGDPTDQPASNRRTRSLRLELKELLPPDRTHDEGTLVACFGHLFELLRYGRDNKLGLPQVMLTTLSPQLVQVLLFWVFLVYRSAGGANTLQKAREDAIRFAMFWRLCVWNEDRASTHCFESLRARMSLVGSVLPDLYRDLIGTDYVLPLATPDEMERYGWHEPSPNWLGEKDRFLKTESGPARLPELYREWWRSRGKFLMWLQRDYLAPAFESFDPASGREDDVPYDLDHMCPASDWGRYWTPFRAELVRAGCLSEPQIEAMRQARFVLGDAIGNFRLIDASKNRGDGDADIRTKMPFVCGGGEPSPCDQREMAEMAFDPDQRAIWCVASGKNQEWDAERLRVFQEAVEQRTHWLYRRFYEDLGFGIWTKQAAQ